MEPEIFVMDMGEVKERLVRIGETMESGDEVDENELKWVYNLACYFLDMIRRGEYKVIPKPPGTDTLQ